MGMRKCEYCSDDGETLADSVLDGDGVLIETSFDGEAWGIKASGYYDGGFCCGGASAKIDFCPMCGRQVEGARE